MFLNLVLQRPRCLITDETISSLVVFEKRKNMSEFLSCIRNHHTFNFSSRALILSAEDKRSSFLPCILEFVLFKWSKILSTKYANSDFQLSSQSKLQNSPCLSRLKKANISSFSLYTRDNTLPRESHLASVCNRRFSYFASIALQSFVNNRDLSGLALMQFTISIPSFNTYVESDFNVFPIITSRWRKQWVRILWEGSLLQVRILREDNFFALLVLSSRRSGGSSLGFRAGSLLARSMQND